MPEGEYLAWVAAKSDGLIVAGLGLWLMDWPSYMTGPGTRRGNILNVYTPRNFAGRESRDACWKSRWDGAMSMGFAASFCTPATAPAGVRRVRPCDFNKLEAISAGIRRFNDGRALYERLGFKPTHDHSERRIHLPENARKAGSRVPCPICLRSRHRALCVVQGTGTGEPPGFMTARCDSERRHCLMGGPQEAKLVVSHGARRHCESQRRRSRPSRAANQGFCVCVAPWVGPHASLNASGSRGCSKQRISLPWLIS